MEKAEYKAVFVLLGVLILMVGIGVNYFSAEVTNAFLAVDTYPLNKGIKPYTVMQTNCAEIAIKVISISADIGGILAIIYGFTSSKRKN